MRDKTKVSCIFKVQNLSFLTPTLFARILGDSMYLSKYAQKWAIKDKICIFTIRETFVLSSICQNLYHMRNYIFKYWGNLNLRLNVAKSR